MSEDPLLSLLRDLYSQLLAAQRENERLRTELLTVREAGNTTSNEPSGGTPSV